MKSNKKIRMIWLEICVLVLLVMLPVSASAVPELINYQGYLTDAGGNPVNGDVAITFRIWDAEVGGTELWSEPHAAVTVTEGVFNVMLGSSVPITAGILGGNCYLGMTIGTDSEMVPRMKVTSAAYAIRARYAESVATGSVTTSALSDTAVTETKIASGAVSNDKLTNGSVTGSKVAAGTLTATHLQDGAALAEVLDDDGEGSGLDADLLDGHHAWEFVSSADDYGRPGVASSLYEGATTLSGKYVNQSGDNMAGRLGVDVIAIGSSWHEAIKGYLSGTSPGAGVFGLASSEQGHGVHGGATGTSGVGVYGETLGPNGYGGYFDGRGYFSGKVGIGTTTPDQKLHVIGLAHFDVGTGHIHISTPGSWPGIIANSPNGNRRDIQFYDNVMTMAVSDSPSAPSPSNGITIGENGGLGVGIGARVPTEKLEIAGNIQVNGDLHMPSNSSIHNAAGREVFHTGWSGAFGDYTSINSGYDWGSDEPISVVAGSEGVFFTQGDASGTPYATTLASINTSGELSCSVLEITGGSDIAEPFEIREAANIKAGMVMAIDPENPGKLRISDRAYDRRVAGVVSGAGGVNPGMRMQQKGSPADGATPIALTGRVYCWSDASRGSIEPGDLLTTSETPGHAMKVTDYARAQGAILGKAMTSLEKGQGLVLVLVTLQ